MKINEVAKLTGVTVRTLHYYDKIGLLKPGEVTLAGYRIYDEDSLKKLQQILFFRELDFSLHEIKQIMNSYEYDQREALAKQRELLIKKRERLNRLIHLVDETMKGDIEMSFKEFDLTEIEQVKEQYTAEVKERWGDTKAYDQSAKKTASYGKEEWKQLWNQGNTILEAFGKHVGQEPESDEVQALVKQWQDFITNTFYDCNKEILKGLGEMYLVDERFQTNINKNGEGTAELLSAAIAAYCAE